MEYLRFSPEKLNPQESSSKETSQEYSQNKSYNEIIHTQEKLLEDIVKSPIDYEDKKMLLARVFDHSVSDGIQLAEKLNITDDEYFKLIQRKEFYIKHRELAQKTIREGIQEAQSEKDKKKIETLKKLYAEYEETLNEGIPFSSKKKENVNTETRDLLNAIDSWYAQFLKTKEFQPLPAERDPRSKGERLAEDVLEQIQLSLEKNYYPGYILRIVSTYVAQTDESWTQKKASELFSSDPVLQERYKHTGFERFLNDLKKG